MVSNKNTISNDTLALMEFESEKRNAGFAYLLFFFFGIFGAHRFYLENKTDAVIMIILNLGSFGGLFFGFFWLGGLGFVFGGGCFIVFIIIWIADLFQIPKMVREYNQELMNKIKNGSEEKNG